MQGHSPEKKFFKLTVESVPDSRHIHSDVFGLDSFGPFGLACYCNVSSIFKIWALNYASKSARKQGSGLPELCFGVNAIRSKARKEMLSVTSVAK